MTRFTKEQSIPRISTMAASIIEKMAEGKNLILNLGAGIPSSCVNYLNNPRIFVHSENGMLGVGPFVPAESADPELKNAGRQYVSETPGCVYFDSAESFALIRGGHIDVTVMGAFEVDASGRMANWTIPGGGKLGVGGAMDLLNGAKNIIVALTHVGVNGPKLVKKCSLPLTGLRSVNYVVTDCGVFHFVDNAFRLEGIAEDISIDEIKEITEFDFDISPSLEVYSVADIT